MSIKVHLPATNNWNGHRRPVGVDYKVTYVVAAGEPTPQLVLRVIYNEPRRAVGDSAVHAFVSAAYGDRRFSGNGSSGSGVGLHKESLALRYALENAGVGLEYLDGSPVNFGGMGRSISETILHFVAAELTGAPFNSSLVINP